MVLSAHLREEKSGKQVFCNIPKSTVIKIVIITANINIVLPYSKQCFKSFIYHNTFGHYTILRIGTTLSPFYM